MSWIQTVRTVLGATTPFVLVLIAGCNGTSGTTDAATDTNPTQDVVADAGADASPIYLLTVQSTLRSAPPSDGGADDASASDAGAMDASTMFDPSYAQMAHNQLVGAAMGPAMAAGDLTHNVGLGTMDPSQFLVLDTWASLQGLTSTITSPGFQAGFAMIFATPPTLGIWVPADGFTTYKTTSSSPTRIYVLVRGTLASPGDGARNLHNMIVSANMATAMAHGDISHTAWVGQMDPTQFLVVDVWTDASGLSGFLGDPQVQMAFASLFSGPPTISTYTPPTGWTIYGMNQAWGTP